jgi:hypothetical protein
MSTGYSKVDLAHVKTLLRVACAFMSLTALFSARLAEKGFRVYILLQMIGKNIKLPL